MATVRLVQAGSGKVFEVSEEAADHWRSLGYQDETKPKAVKKAAAKKPAKKRASADNQNTTK